MKLLQDPSVRLLMMGAAPRLAVAALLVLLLWAGFIWATSPVGGS
ncbi:MAG: hypothetical protein AAF441_19315 [Pseudomonadota bacterium]